MSFFSIQNITYIWQKSVKPKLKTKCRPILLPVGFIWSDLITNTVLKDSMPKSQGRYYIWNEELPKISDINKWIYADKTVHAYYQ